MPARSILVWVSVPTAVREQPDGSFYLAAAAAATDEAAADMWR